MLRQLSRSPPAPRAAWMLLLLAIMLLAGPAAAEAPVSLVAPGATLEEVLAIARRLSPELAPRALDTEAAQARVEIAGSLADPTLRITSDEIDRTSGPRQNKMFFTVEQEFPLWGDPHDRGFASGRALHCPCRAGPLRPGARFAAGSLQGRS